MLNNAKRLVLKKKLFHESTKKNLKIYVIHYTPLKERKEFQKKQLNDLSLRNTEFIENYDKESLSSDDVIKFNKNKLSLPVISLFKKHIFTLELIQKSKYSLNLILEDDAILNKNFNNLLSQAVAQLPKDYDMLFIDEGPGLHIPSTSTAKLVYKKDIYPSAWGGNGATRGSGGILVNKKCTEKIYNFYKKMEKDEIDLPIDYWLNVAIRELKLNIYWMEPTIIRQGSVTGKFNSSL